jgi:Ca2+:H+ antiporter
LRRRSLEHGGEVKPHSLARETSLGHKRPVKSRLRFGADWLFVFLPATVGADYLSPDSHVLIFATACLAIVPLASWMGKATEHLVEHTGAGLGGLLNATFGNAAEMIIAFSALRSGLVGVVKASITGAIIGNVLLVLGLSLFLGGLRHPIQTFNAAAARTHSTMLLLAAIALVAPASYHYLAGGPGAAREGSLSDEVSAVLLLCYALGLVFSLRTHRELFAGHSAEAATLEDGGEGHWSLGRSLGVLATVTVLIAVVSEILVGSVEHVAQAFGMSEVFVGVIVLAAAGSAAEQSTAIMVARKNRMDLALSITVGSSIQIALFVAPVLVLASQFLAPTPMNLVFTPAEVLAVTISALIAGQICGDGESNWLEGVQLLAVYLIVALLFYFLPAHAG